MNVNWKKTTILFQLVVNASLSLSLTWCTKVIKTEIKFDNSYTEIQKQTKKSY